MIFRRRFLHMAVAFATVLPALTSPRSLSADTGADAAGAFVKTMTQAAGKALRGEDRAAKRAGFHDLVQDFFAYRTIAQWVLGRHWRRATKEQQDEFLSLFEEVVFQRYTRDVKEYATGQTFSIRRIDQRRANDYIVYTELKQNDASPPIEIGWRVGAATAENGTRIFKIVDIMFSGLSMALTQQKEFNALLKNNGNSIDALLAKMRSLSHDSE